MSSSMASTSTDTYLSLTVIRASEVKWCPTFRNKLPNLYVEIELNDKCRRTGTVKSSLSPNWDERFSFELPTINQGSKLKVRIKHNSLFWKDTLVGHVDIELDQLLRKYPTGKEMEFILDSPRTSVSTEGAAALHLRVETMDATSSAKRDINAAEQAIKRGGVSAWAATTDSTAVATVDAVGNQLAGYSDLYQSVGNLVSKLDLFVGVVDKLSQVHPYVNVTWQVASLLYKCVSNQFEVDKKVVELVYVMEDAFNFVHGADSLRNKTQYLESTIIKLLKQTNECCSFVQEYACHTFTGRMLKIDVQGKVDEFTQSLRSLKQSIDSGVVIHTAFVSSRISSKVDTLFLSDRLHPDQMDAFNRPQCLSGTRTEIIKQVMEWALLDSNQNVFWLHGAAGSGKSTVSTTIAEHFRSMSRLGAHLFFERGKSDPSCVIRTLAYKLALFDSSVGNKVIEAIQRDSDIAQATSATQFEDLLHGPLNLSRDAMHGPIVIVLDALDECGTEKTRRNLIETFRNGLPELPRNFRFFITSRMESDISQALSSRPEHVHIVELEHSSDSCRDDVLRYLKHAMRNVFEVRSLPIPDDWQLKMGSLATAAAGLFVWASTAVKLVDCDNPTSKLTNLVSQSQHLTGLEQLYNSVLSSSGISFGDESSKARFSQVLGFILLSKTQLFDTTIDGLLGFSRGEPSRLILSRLQSVLVFSRDSHIRFCHTSFRDYLLAPARENDPWFIDLECQKAIIVRRCFEVMRSGLRFNICDIRTSYIPNDRIAELPERIKTNIPPPLEYACLFWPQHLREANFLQALLDELIELLYFRLLYWIEVMSLLGEISIVSPSLLHIMNWVSSRNSEVLAFLRDTRRIITRFALPISQSTPHVYVSALLFASMESKFIARYLKHDLPFVQVEQRGIKQQSPLLKELIGHEGWVNSVTFSPDGTRVASGSSDRTVRIWDAESGRVVSGPFEGHTDQVLSVAFSPEGSRVVSGSWDMTIRIWDVESGQVISGPLQGHTDWINSVAFSPDGTRVVSGSSDGTCMIWNVDNGQLVSLPFEGHTDEVRSVAFSSDGRRIVSGADDETIRIWDTESGNTVCGPLEGHTGCVQSVAFSADCTRVISGSADSTIRIWDAQSGRCISGPFERHINEINSVTFSPDGARIASGSHDNTVRIWDVESGQVVSSPFNGHASGVMSVAFSPDGTRVVSGCADSKIRIWDADGVQTVFGPFEGHVDGVNSVAFSSDGKYVASGSDDATIRIWDAESGNVASAPFTGHSAKVLSVAFSPEGKHVVSGSNDHTIQVWDVESGYVVSGPLEGHEGCVLSVAFSPDGTRVASGSEDNTLRIWHVDSGKTVFGPFKGHNGYVCSVSFSHDGRHVVSGSDDETIIIWDVETGQAISGPFRGHTRTVWSVAFSPDDACVVSGSADTTILIWDARSGEVKSGPLEGHTDWIRSVGFSADGTRVVSGSDDGTMRVWDAGNGQVIFAPFEGHTGSVRSAAFSPDGLRVVSGSADHTIRIWNVKDPTFDWTIAKDGWIHGREGELLVWIPPDLWRTLWRPQTTVVSNCAFSTRVDFTNAALGERWQECFVSSQ